MIVSRYGDDRILYPQRRVYTAPEQCGYSGLPYLDPNNLNQKILEEKFPKDFVLPDQLPGQNRHAVTRKPSDNLTIHMNYVPVQFKTYELLDNREGSSLFNAPIPDVGPKLRTKADIATASYINNLSKDTISFHSEYAKVGEYPAISRGLDNLASLIDTRRPLSQILYSKTDEPVGQVFRDVPNYSKTHRKMNASALAPELQAQEELRRYQKTGKWC